MSKCHSLWSVGLLLVGLTAAWGQESSPQHPEETPATPQQPVPAYGPGSVVPSTSENPPISGLDMPNLEPHAAPLSYLQAGAHVSESVDSNIQNTLGGSSVQTITRGEGSIDLRRLWSNYDLSLDYLGGVGYYAVRGVGLKQIQELGAAQKINWKRGNLAVRDAFSYQPEGTFGSSYGAVGATGAGLAGENVFFGGTGLGTLGDVPRIMNLTVADAVESLTPKSTITAAAGYGFVHFLQNEPGTTLSFIGDSQVSGQVGYSRLLGHHDQGALVYGYQHFHFSTGVDFHSHIIQLMWGHRISGRMDFLASAGPQFTQINGLQTPVAATTQNLNNPACTDTPTQQGLEVVCPTNDLRISAAGRGSLRYRFPRLELSLTYDHFLTNGSGFFAGAESDVVRFSASRPLNRVWSVVTDIGYSRNSRVLSNSCASNSATTSGCQGVSANVFQYGFAGVSVHRMLGRTLHAFASYQFNELTFDRSFCQGTSACSRSSERQVGTIGLDWIPRPIRLD
jgi:hypothetical protein